MKDIFNPSMRKQFLKKIIDDIEITYDTTANGKSKSLHVIFRLKNSIWHNTHIYFSDLEYSTKDIKRIEYEFKKLKEFFEEVEK